MKKETMSFTAGCLSLVCLLMGPGASAAMMELEWTLPGGKVERETRPLPEKDGMAVFSLSRAEIKSRGASSLALTPDFARARKGDDGFWDYAVRAELASGDVVKTLCERCVFSEGVFYAEVDETKPVVCAFNRKDIPTKVCPRQKIRFVVTPRSCFGLEGKPIASEWMSIGEIKNMQSV